MIEDSEKLKSGVESKAESLADRLVPYTLGGTVLTWLLTRNVTKALAVLMVDFSCALKLSLIHISSSAVIDQGINCLLKHTFLITNDDIRCSQIQQSLQTVISVDNSSVQIVQVGSRCV